MRVCLFLTIGSMILVNASTAFAQDRSVWGFSASFAPKWEVADQLKVLFEDAETVDISGNEFRVGVVRGRPLGGDWGVSFVRKSFKDGAGYLGEAGEFCFNNQCTTLPMSAVFQDTVLTGVEVHKFIPFVTIKERAQIGLTVAGGIASWKGTVRVTETDVDFINNQPIITTRTEDFPAQEAFALGDKPMPLFRLEIGGNVIASDSFKLRVGGGLNFPGWQVFSVQGIFLMPQ